MKSKKAISCIAVLLIFSTICRFTVFAEGEIIKNPETIQVESIKISVTNTIMQIGETQKLRVSITPPNAENFELEYFSSNANVITAAIGTIIANEEGTADITVKAKGTEISDTITITVIKNEDVLIQDIEIYSENIYLEEFEETKIKYDIIPSNATNPKLIFSSLNTSIASSNLTGRPLLTPDEVSRIKRPFSLVTTRTYPAIMRSPDLSMWYFNKMFGLGDPEHNRMVREERENRRNERTCDGKPALWGIWNIFKEKSKQSHSGTRRNYQRVSGIQEIPKDITGKEGYSDEIRQNIKEQD